MSVHYPNRSSADAIELDAWSEVERGTIVPPAGQQSVFAFASDETWIPLLRSLGVSDDSLGTATFNPQSSPTARQVAEGISADLAERTNWARFRQSHVIQESRSGA